MSGFSNLLTELAVTDTFITSAALLEHMSGERSEDR